MPTSASSARESWTPKTEEDLRRVHQEVNEIVLNEHFRGSNRCPALLRYVVEMAVHGAPDDLKERTIGIEVFHRPPDYDNMDDPVVRVCASEIRRRIALYYSENPDRPIEIEIPTKGYVPHFWRRAAATGNEGPSPFGNADPGTATQAAAEADIAASDKHPHRSRALRRYSFQ